MIRKTRREIRRSRAALASPSAKMTRLSRPPSTVRLLIFDALEKHLERFGEFQYSLFLHIQQHQSNAARSRSDGGSKSMIIDKSLRAVYLNRYVD